MKLRRPTLCQAGNGDKEMADYILSVDGGGTKTEFCISDMEGHIKESVVVGLSLIHI